MGKLIVIEGTDGSGKATQTALAAESLRQRGLEVRTLDFPRYRADSSVLVRHYLAGKYGTRPEDVNAYAASTFYAVDRFASYREDWGGFYRAGGIVLTDRYTTANAVHQAPKLPEGERESYVNWLFDFEYRLLGLPKPDLVLYLDLPTALAEALLRQRREKTGEKADIHEKNEAYLALCRQCGLALAAREGWRVVSCAKDGALRPVEEIHGEVISLIE
ncbi:MAG: dTMP kinase, partial [bacterium]